MERLEVALWSATPTVAVACCRCCVSICCLLLLHMSLIVVVISAVVAHPAADQIADQFAVAAYFSAQHAAD